MGVLAEYVRKEVDQIRAELARGIVKDQVAGEAGELQHPALSSTRHKKRLSQLKTGVSSVFWNLSRAAARD